ncbi:hypothetical protein IEQ34_026067 [Dendrobium chrysotoxum]|uniref:Uncharacterized protein n=1 Tax=Dendrobium chrysotoxum TaxID=161865 RepID=A0AAV7FMK3_DENCH|nr:hypothetical protein IEQ34_026067 [Dendrobium chrysotoxum]
MCLCSYWSKSIFCGSGSDYFPGRRVNGIHSCGSRNSRFACYHYNISLLIRERLWLNLLCTVNDILQEFLRISPNRPKLIVKYPLVVKLIQEMFFICIHDFWKEPLMKFSFR